MKANVKKKLIGAMMTGTAAVALMGASVMPVFAAENSDTQVAIEDTMYSAPQRGGQRNGGTQPGGPMGQQGEMPDMHGEMPELPSSNGEFGTRPEMPQGGMTEGTMPQFPGMSGERPEMPSDNQDSESSDDIAHGMPNSQGQENSTRQNERPSFNIDANGVMENNGSMTRPEMNGRFQQNNGMQGGMMGQNNVTYADAPTDIVESDVENSASSLQADEKNAETITMNASNNQVEISESGTYIITGKCSDGNIMVKKGTTGVVLILKDLDLTSRTGATVSCNKESEVKIVVEGDVKLTDAENPEDEDSTDTDVSDAFDGAAIKVKDGANVYLTGDGSLTIDASSCKNGIKIGDTDTAFTIDGDLSVNITAANDGINSGYDLTILNGVINIDAEDDGIHADRILTIGSEEDAPEINITATEGLEGTIVNLFNGTGTISSSDDAVNAANKDGLFADSLQYAINVTGGQWTIGSKADGLDSNGDINLTDGSVTINSASAGGEFGIDYISSLYVADGVLENNSGVSGPDQMPGGRQDEMFGKTEQLQRNSSALPEDSKTDDSEAGSSVDSFSSTSPSQNNSGFFGRLGAFFKNWFGGNRR